MNVRNLKVNKTPNICFDKALLITTRYIHF